MRANPEKCAHCGGPPLTVRSELGLSSEGRLSSSDRFFFCSDECLTEEIDQHVPKEYRLDKTPADHPDFDEMEKDYLATGKALFPEARRFRSNEELAEIREFDDAYRRRADEFAKRWGEKQKEHLRAALKKVRATMQAHEDVLRRKEEEAQREEWEKEEAKRLEAEEAEREFEEMIEPRPIPDELRFSGTWIIAPPGRGKTNLLNHLFQEDLAKRASIIVMDSKGELIKPIKELRAVKDRLTLVEPHADFPLALNPLDIPKTNIAHTISLLEYIFSALLEAKMTALQMTLFRSVLPALIEAIPNPTLETFRDIIVNGTTQYEHYIRRLPSSQQHFFFDKDTGFLSKTYAETRTQLTWRLQLMMTNPIIKQMFGAPRTKFDIGKEMDAGKIILIDNSKAILGPEGSEFFGRFFIALILAAAQQRSGRRREDKVPCFVYIDECQTVIERDDKIATILDECRSQKIGLILAHQRSGQLNPPVLDAVANCAVRYANSDDEAKFLADKLRTTPDFLRSLPTGTFAVFARDLTREHCMRVPIPYIGVDALPKMAPAEQRAILQRMREQFSWSPQAEARSEPVSAASRVAADAAVDGRPLEPANPHQGDHTKPAKEWGS